MMSKERLLAFRDAVLAIIMTILVLEWERPTDVTWSAIWELRTNYFAYTISFFWLGTMWVNHHRTWDAVEKINNRLVWCSVLLLFFSSFFSYTTSLVSSHFNNPVAQALYGIVVLLVTASNVWMYHELQKVDESYIQGDHFNILNSAGIADIIIKLIGLALTLTIWPAAMMWAVLFTAAVIVIPRAL